MKFDILLLVCLSFSFISSLERIQEIEYMEKVTSKYNKNFTYFSIKFDRKEGIIAKYQRGIRKYEIDGDTLELIDLTGDEGLKTFELTNEELGLKQNKELFKYFDKMDFPEETEFFNPMFIYFPEWHIIVDGKDYKSNVKTEFYLEFNDLVNIEEVRDYVINLYDN